MVTSNYKSMNTLTKWIIRKKSLTTKNSYNYVIKFVHAKLICCAATLWLLCMAATGVWGKKDFWGKTGSVPPKIFQLRPSWMLWPAFTQVLYLLMESWLHVIGVYAMVIW